MQNLAEQLQNDIKYDKIISRLSRELRNSSSVFITNLELGSNLTRLKEDGFKVNSDGQWREGGVFVSFKQKNQWRD